ncbi:MAG: hypothetical protein IKR72_02755 [Bacteroidales bacterium]|nr:hypothetical protein [Bacteroidales bacterium]
MRKYMKYIAAGLVIMIGASCEKIQETTENEIKEIAYDGYGVPMSFKAKGQDVMKSDIDVGASAIVWDSDDAIAIYDGSQLREFSVSSRSYGNKIATFSGSAADVSTYYSVTPYSAATLDTDIKVTIPATQTVIGDHCVDGEAMVATATVAAGADISFTNQFSLLKISLSGSDIVSVTLTGKSDEAICGEKVLSTSDGTFSGTPEGKTINLVYKASKEGAYGAFPAGDYFVVLWPGEFTGGFKLIMTKSDGSKAIKSTSADVTFALNSGANASTIDDVTFAPSTIMNASQLKMWRRIAEYYTEGEEVKLGADIDLGGYAWTPVEQFIGIFNGQNHKIYNFTIESDAVNVGFIGQLGSSSAEEAQLKNVVFGSSNGTSYDGTSSITVTTDRSGWTYGGIVGYAQKKSTISGVTSFVPVTAAASVTGKHAIGGISGSGNGGSGNGITITGCHNYGAITDNSASTTTENSAIGGILGATDGSYTVVSSCVNHAAVHNYCAAVSRIGGIVGKAWDAHATITECTNEGDITNEAASVTDKASSWDNAVGVGGILGAFTSKNGGLLVNKCTNSGTLTMAASPSESYRTTYGGIVGNITYAGTIKGCTNTGEFTETVTCAALFAVGGILGLGNTSSLVITKADDDTYNTNSGALWHLKEHSGECWYGGIVGLAQSSNYIEYCTNNGRVISDPSGQSATINFNAGGICGSSQKIIRNCTNNGYVFTYAGKLTSYIGGICGGRSLKPTQITDCTNTGFLSPFNASGSSVCGGILAILDPNNTTVHSCVNSGMVTTGDFYRNGSGNTPGTLRNFESKNYYMGGLFGYVNAPTADVTDNVTDCIVACTFGQRTGSESKDNYKGIIAGQTRSTSSTAYKMVFGTAEHPILIVNTTNFQYGTNANPAVITQGDVITTTALANKWLMGSSSNLYDSANGSSDTSKVDFNYVIATPAQAGIE